MCGINGIYYFQNTRINKSEFNSANNLLKHRGPDNGHIWVNENVALGHRRLSIIDLDNSSNQPFFSVCKNYVLVYNGELYNYIQLRNELKNLGYSFITNSDTEVVLQSFIHYGESAFERFNGMFSLAIYNIQKGELYLARDMFGIKPLYIFKNEDKFIFSSEIKGIKAFNVSTSLNKQSLVEYLWYGNTLGQNTFFREIEELEPGTFLKIKNKKHEIKSFFNIYNIKENSLDVKEIEKKTKSLLEQSIKRHLISDVPVAVFLSGGIDSSAITYFASKNYKNKLDTYSVNFDYEKGNDELPLARKVAEKNKTNHNEINISGNDIIKVIKQLSKAHDQPFADAANIPLYILTEKLKGKVKVVLQGDGGDEIFGGYSRYNTIQFIGFWKIFRPFVSLLYFIGLRNLVFLRFHRFIMAITEEIPYKRHALLLTLENKWTQPLGILSKKLRKDLESYDPFIEYESVYKKLSSLDKVQSMFFCDTKIILKNTFLEKVDRSTMMNSIEVRVPFLDKELTEFMFSVPSKFKVSKGRKKYLLKKVLKGLIPNEILFGKKKGFGVPYGFWIKTSLKDFFIEEISTNKLKDIIDEEEVMKRFNQHINGVRDNGFILWKVLILAVWLNHNEK